MKHIYHFFIVFILLSTVISAQVNIEKYNSINYQNGFWGNLSLYLSAKTGNTDIQEFGTDGRINYKGENFYSFLIGQGEYGWNKGREYSNNALVHFRFILNSNRIMKPEVFSQINYNKKQLLLFRSLGGGGVRITIVSDSIQDFTFGTSYMYEYEKLDLPLEAIHSNITNSHRWSNYLSYSNKLSSNSRISIVVYAQPRFDNFSDIRILSENNFSVGLTKTLALSIQFSLRYDSKPPDNVKALDTSTKVGFSVKF